MALQQQVAVLAEGKEWDAAADSDQDDVEKHESDTYANREKRLSFSVVVLQQENVLGDSDVAVVQETAEWAGAAAVGEEDGDDKENHETVIFAAREKRLSFSQEALQTGGILGDADVNVKQSAEWADGADSDGEEAKEFVSARERHESGAFTAREKRLSVAEKAIDVGAFHGDSDINVSKQSAEWADGDDSDDEGCRFEKASGGRFAGREKRLSIAQDALEKQTVLGDAEVHVLQHTAEWGEGGADSDEEGEGGRLDKAAAGRFAARERRITAGAEAIDKELVVGDSDIHVLKQTSEWAEGDDSDEERCKFETASSGRFANREKRLSLSVEALQKETIIGDTDVHILASGEWAEGDDSDEERCKFEAASSSRFAKRERRITVSADVIEKELVVGDSDVNVLKQTSEWADGDDSDEERCKFEAASAGRFASREKRLSLSVEALQKETVLGDVDVHIMASAEWEEGHDSDEERCKFEAASTDRYANREKRLSVSAEALGNLKDAAGAPASA